MAASTRVLELGIVSRKGTVDSFPQFLTHVGLRWVTDQTLDHFSRYAPERIEYGVNRYVNETRRLYSVLDTHLGSDKRQYLVGDKCTIAGMFYGP